MCVPLSRLGETGITMAVRRRKRLILGVNAKGFRLSDGLFLHLSPLYYLVLENGALMVEIEY